MPTRLPAHDQVGIDDAFRSWLTCTRQSGSPLRASSAAKAPPSSPKKTRSVGTPPPEPE